MNKQEYQEQLKSSEWKTKRLEILERDNYVCQECGSKSNLHIHHKYYLNNYNAWEYLNDALITLCKDCHKNLHNNLKDKERVFYITFFEAFKILNKCNKIDRQVIDILMKYSEFNTNIVNITTYIKDNIISEINIASQTLSNTLSKLKKKEIIFPVIYKGKLRKGTYLINPVFFWKGNISENEKYIKELTKSDNT